MAEGVAADVHQASIPTGRLIYDLITANNLDGIRSLVNPLTLRHRQSIVCQTVCGKTLLGRACELGFRHIAKYLLDECGADISDRFSRRQRSVTPLEVSIGTLDVAMTILLLNRGAVALDKLAGRFCAVYALKKGYFLVTSILRKYTNPVEYLEDTSELPNIIARKTEMHTDPILNLDSILRASSRGDIGSIMILLRNGIPAKVTDLYEENALCKTILYEKSNAEYFLLNYGVFSLKDHIRALEFCGAKFIIFKSNFEKALRCWRKAVRIRTEEFFGVSDKFQNELKTALGFEFSCEEELDKLVDNKAELYIQALLVFVRLLSPTGEVLGNAFVIVASQPVFHTDLLRAIQVLAELYVLPYLPVSGFTHPFQRSTASLNDLFRYHFQSDPSDVGDFLLKLRNLLDFINRVNWKKLLNGDKEFHLIVYRKLLTLTLRKTIAKKYLDLCPNDELWIKDEISRILKYHSDPYPTTLLHVAIQDPTAYSVIPFILSCSADANCTDDERNTPLHMVPLLFVDKTYRLHLVNLLTDAGGHIDSVNTFNTTPLMGLQDNDDIQNPLRFLSLQCLAAQTVHKYNIKVPDVYPKILRSFIKLHSR